LNVSTTKLACADTFKSIILTPEIGSKQEEDQNKKKLTLYWQNKRQNRFDEYTRAL